MFTMKKVFIYILLLPLFAIFFASCNSDDIVVPVSPAELKKQTLVNVLSEQSYSPQQFVDTLGAPTMTAIMEYIYPEFPVLAKILEEAKLLSRLPELDKQFVQEVGVGPFGTRRWEFQSYVFSYRSWTVDGREILMSGRVTFPNNKVEGIDHQVKTLSLHSHQALLGADCAPSENLMYMPLRALWDSAVIEPDYQQFGINYKKEYCGYGAPAVLARQLADCTTAALEVMRMHGVTLAPDGYTTNWGNSQGGWTTLAFAHYYETEAPDWFRNAIRLRSTFTGEGPCDVPSFLLDYACAHPELLDTEANLLIAYFYAFRRDQLGGYSAEDFVAPWLNEKKFELEDGRKISLLQAISMGVRDYDEYFSNLVSLQQIFAADLFNPDGSMNTNCHKYETWAKWLRANNNFFGWNPGLPIYLAHCKDDVVVPYESVERLYNDLSGYGNNPLVHLAEVPSIGKKPIRGFDPHYIISFLMQVQMACVKEPEDMMNIYIPVK